MEERVSAHISWPSNRHTVFGNKHGVHCLLLDLKLMDTGEMGGSVGCREGNLSKEYGKGAWAVAVWWGE